MRERGNDGLTDQQFTVMLLADLLLDPGLQHKSKTIANGQIQTPTHLAKAVGWRNERIGGLRQNVALHHPNLLAKRFPPGSNHFWVFID